MKTLPQFNKQQLEVLRVALLHLTSNLHQEENLAKTIFKVDYYFEGMFGYPNPIDKQRLIYDQENYVEEFFNPIDDLIGQLLDEALPS